MDETVVVTNCAVGLARVNTMSMEGVSSSDALAIEVETSADDHLQLLLPPAMAGYLAYTCREIAREVSRRRSSVVSAVLDGFVVFAALAVLTAFFIVCYTSGLTEGIVRVFGTVAVVLGAVQMVRLTLRCCVALLRRALVCRLLKDEPDQ